jgi:hypothetical protein
MSRTLHTCKTLIRFGFVPLITVVLNTCAWLDLHQRKSNLVLVALLRAGIAVALLAECVRPYDTIGTTSRPHARGL